MWTIEEKEKVLQALAVICQMTGTDWQESVLKTVLVDLMPYPFESVKAALMRVRRECRGRLTLAAILDCLDDGYPSADEAWAQVSDGMTSEALTIVIPEIAQLAAGEARTLWVNGDKYGARMAFTKMYDRMKAQQQGAACKWVIEAGTDKEQRDAKVKEAVEMGRIQTQRALGYLADHSPETRELLQTGKVLTPEQRQLGQKNTGRLLSLLADKIVKSEVA